MILPVRPHFFFDQIAGAFQIPVPIRSAGSPTILETCLLLTVGRIVKAQRIFEIGTYRGQTTRALAANFPEAQIATLDLSLAAWEGATPPNVTRHAGHSLATDFSQFLPGWDLIFIDGGHDYQTVKADTQHARNILNGGGAIVWHDFGKAEYEVTRYLEELSDLIIYRVEETSLCIRLA